MTSTDDEFLPDEFVLDDVPEEQRAANVVFAGPSDAPPASPSRAARVRRPTDRRPLGPIAVAILSAAAAVAAVFAASRPLAHDAVSGVAASPASDPTPASVAATMAPAESAPSPTSPPAAGALGVAPADAGVEAAAEDPAIEEATQAKQAAERFLEKGATAQAIEQGERAVALDPADAEAWLILGAGYDQRGAYARARRCFATCSRVATRGPRRECAALLR
jgi:tetratricopeptide (TPR) repeat protein